MSETLEPVGIRRLFALTGKVKQRGVAWLWQRCKRELFAPTTAPARMLGRVRVAIGRNLNRFTRARHSTQDDVLFFFLDLEVCPVTFDIVTYLAAAELRRRELNLRSIHIVVVPGTVNGLRAETPGYEAVIDVESRRWRLYNLVVPLFRLLPTCSGYTMCGSRASAVDGPFAQARHVFPTGYGVNVPIAPNAREVCDIARSGRSVLPMLRATPKALAYVAQFLEPRARGRRILIINLRQSPFMPSRNSTNQNWFTFAGELDKSRWLPVFVLDTDVALDQLPPELNDFTVCHAISWNIELRMALYELADLTMAIGQGPMELCRFNDRCKYAFFVRPNASPQSSEEALSAQGFEIGKDPPYAVSGQRWIWTSDDLPNIRSAFAELSGE